jgi:hypothetical protein
MLAGSSYQLSTCSAHRCRLVHAITWIGYPHVMHWFGPIKAHVVLRSVAFRHEVYAPQGITGQSIRVGRG